MLTDLLQTMGDSARDLDLDKFFWAQTSLLQFFTPEELLEQKITVPPWQLPDGVQMMMLHMQMSLLMNVMNQSTIFGQIVAAKKQKEGSGLVDPSGRLIV